MFSALLQWLFIFAVFSQLSARRHAGIQYEQHDDQKDLLSWDSYLDSTTNPADDNNDVVDDDENNGGQENEEDDDEDDDAEDEENDEEDEDDEDEENDKDEDDDEDTTRPEMSMNISSKCDLCQQPFSPLGCYDDSHCSEQRPLTKLLFETGCCESKDNATLHKQIASLACLCAAESRKRGYTVFGLQDFRQCWSGPDGETTYKKDGAGRQCYNANKQQCNATRDRLCIGDRNTNYVYQLDPLSSSAVRYSKVGCYADKQESRALPSILDNHRDIHSKVYDGVLIDWTNFQLTLERLVEHCAEKTKQKGFKYFGLQNYGECWSGPEAESSYKMHGTSSGCINTVYQPCDPTKDCLCVGKQFSNFVYRLE